MAVGDSWGAYKTPCPNCGGKVNYAFYGSDDSYSQSSSSIRCTGKCRREFTVAEWDLIARDEMREIERRELKNGLIGRVETIVRISKRNPGLAKQLKKALERVTAEELKSISPFLRKEQAELSADLTEFHYNLVEFAETYKKLLALY